MLTTTSIFLPAREGTAWLEQVLIDARLGLVAVADAPGAAADGRAGVRLALEAVRRHLAHHDDLLARFVASPSNDLRNQLLAVIDAAIGRAAQEVHAFARRREGLRVTLDLVWLTRHEAFIGHVGDGRIYLVRRGLVHQLTVDHVGDPTSPGVRATIVALGDEPSVRPETLCIEVAEEDRFVACCGPLHRSVPEGVLHSVFTDEPLDGLQTALSAGARPLPLVGVAAQMGSGAPSEPEWARRRLAALAPVPLFAHCTEAELREIAKMTRPRRFRAEARIFAQGEPGRELFLVMAGRVRIERDDVPITVLEVGSNFGEMSLLDEPVRSASAVAEGETELLAIDRDAFFSLLRASPTLAVKVLWNMLLRLSAFLRHTSVRRAELERRLAELGAMVTPVPPPRVRDQGGSP
jgi:CRP-like cAMP-binding protein/serine/threonine protein phosphatase PrpC